MLLVEHVAYFCTVFFLLLSFCPSNACKSTNIRQTNAYDGMFESIVIFDCLLVFFFFRLKRDNDDNNGLA